MDLTDLSMNDLVKAFVTSLDDEKIQEVIDSFGGANVMIEHFKKEIAELEHEYKEAITFRKTILKKLLPFTKNN